MCPQFSTSRHVLQASDSSWWSNKADGSQQASLKGLHELLRLAAHGPTVRFVKRRTCIPNRTTFEVEVQGYLEPYFECLGGSSGSFLSRLTSPLLVYLQPLENQTIPSLSYTKMLGDQDTCEGAIHISPTEINATVMHTIQRNRGLSQPANRWLFRCTTIQSAQRLSRCTQDSPMQSLAHRLPLFVTRDSNGRIDWTSRNALDFTFRPLRVL